jgi:hypothetical protein
LRLPDPHGVFGLGRIDLDVDEADDRHGVLLTRHDTEDVQDNAILAATTRCCEASECTISLRWPCRLPINRMPWVERPPIDADRVVVSAMLEAFLATLVTVRAQALQLAVPELDWIAARCGST